MAVGERQIKIYDEQGELLRVMAVGDEEERKAA